MAPVDYERVRSAFEHASLPALVASAGAAYVLFVVLYRLTLAPTARLPGPPLAKVTNLWKARQALNGTIMPSLEALHDQHGAVVVIAPNEVSIRSATDIQQIYLGKDFIKAPSYYKTWWPDPNAERPGHFPTIDPAHHAKYRRPVAALYAMKSVLEREELFLPSISDLQATIDDRIDANEPFDLGQLIHFFTYDVVGEIGFGAPFGFLKTGKDVQGMIENLNCDVKYGHLCGQLPALRPWIRHSKLSRTVGHLVGRYWGYNTSPDSFYVRAFGRVSERYAAVEKGTYVERGDFLDVFMNTKDPDTGKLLNPRQATLEAMDLLGAGSDTTATAIRSILIALMDHPHILKRVQAEIDDAVSAGTVSFPITYAQSIKLPLTQACIKEAMRLQPSVGATMPRLVPAGGATIAGHFFPAGTVVGMAPRVVHTDTAAFGDDAKVFNPDRWLGPKKAEMDKYIVSFGAGLRICIGRNISVCEIAKTIPTLVNAFEFEYATAQKYDVWTGWFNLHENFIVRAKRRV